MKTLHLSIIITGAVSASAIAGLVVLIQLQAVQQPEVYTYVIHEPYQGADKNFGTVTIQNKTFHVASINPAFVSWTKPFWEEMYDVNFSFPNGYGPQITPGGEIYETYVKFPDEQVPYRMAVGFSSSPGSPQYNFTTVLSTHKEPQAGFTIHNGTIQLLLNWSKIHSDLSILGLNDTYALGRPIEFQIKAGGFDNFNAGEIPDINITREDGAVVWQNPHFIVLCCPSELTDYDRTFNFTNLMIQRPLVLNQTGLYKIIARYNFQTVEKNFSIISPKPTSIYDTGINSLSAMVINTNFTVNYNIREGQVSEIKLDNQSRSLEIFLHVTGKGTITIDLPRALIDAKVHGNTDDRFIVLADGQEIEYKEIHKTIQDRTLSIPFQQGVNKIEIIATQLI